MSEPQTEPASAGPDPATAESRLCVLIASDRAAGGAALAEQLGGLAFGELRVELAPDLPNGLSALAQGRFDCLLLVLEHPDAQGYDALARLRAQAPDLPVVVLAPAGDDALGLTLIAAGAEDALFTDRANGRGIVRALRHAVARRRLRRQTEAAEFEVLGGREQRDVAGMLTQGGRPGEAARIYGAATLREIDPRLFGEIVDDYIDLIKHAAESQVFRTAPSAGRGARALAEHLGFLGAGPRDAIEIHTQALSRLDQGLSAADHRQIALEGRIVVLEVMGYLASYYRRYYLGSMTLGRDQAGAVEGSPS